MKKEHKYAQALRWIADGENLQIRWGKYPRWLGLPERNERVMDEILRGAGEYEFRIKPRTVKIGNREVEAPVLEPVAGQELWQVHEGTQYESLSQFKYHAANSYAVECVKSGLAFSNPGAAREAAAAISALMRGEA